MLPLLLLTIVAADLFDLDGRIAPAARASISLHRVLSPYGANTLAEPDGRFRFKKLEAGAYTVTIFIPSRGEARHTVEVGPSTADSRQRVSVKLELKDSDFVVADVLKRYHAVSAKHLAIAPKAIHEYEEAQRAVGKNDVADATAHLEKAVTIAPHFAPAWNHLGTIAYQTQQYPRAAECFRRALDYDPDLYEPLVNLGGVLLNLHQPREAYDYNLHAVLTRPNDALANSQFGMSYWYLGNLDMAEKYLRKAVELDPTHFSHPQLLLAEIHKKRGDQDAVAADMASFKKHHPDWKP
jgi:tetratricopeptide (TPR) repeat protein